MDIKQLNALSPLRAFEDSINGGLGKGKLGVIVSKHGVGKTACLVHLATDKLFKGEHVIHVSFSGRKFLGRLLRYNLWMMLRWSTIPFLQIVLL